MSSRISKRLAISAFSLLAVAATATPSVAAQMIRWGDTAASLGISNAAGQRFSYACPARDTASWGSVWGTDFYTSDTVICSAAVHVGAISEKGGNVNIVVMGAQQAYFGNLRRGVQSSPYGPWSSTYIFVR